MLSTQDITYLRNGGHVATLYLSVFKPDIVYVGTVNGAHARGANQITVTDVFGSIADVETGMTTFIGTTQADYDVSRRRLRSRSGQVLTVDENSVIWAAGQYVTVYRNWEFWPIFPYIDTDPPYTFYKDRDVTYTDQNEEPSPIARMGGHRAFFFNGTPIVVALTGVGQTVAQGATISNYLWESTGGTIASASSANTTITFNSPGQYLIELTVTDSNGKTQKTTRVYFVHTRDGANQPYRDFDCQYMRANWRSGGRSTVVTVNGDASIEEFPDRALILIWSEQQFDGVERFINNGTGVLFCGYIVRDESTVDKLFNTDTVAFEAYSVDDLMRRHENFNVSLADNPSPTKWYQYKNLSIGRALHHLWKWHSTLFRVCDVHIPASFMTSYLMFACDDFNAGTLYQMADTFLFNNGNHSRVVCSADGSIHVERDVNYMSDSDRDTVEVQYEITDADRRPDSLILDRQHYRSVSMVMLSGTVYDGNVFTPIIAKSPGEVPNTDGNRSMQMERQVLLSQQDANERVGRVHAVQDAIFRGLPIPFHGNYSFIDIVPQKWHTIDVTGDDTLRGYNLQDFRLLPRVVTMAYQSQPGYLFVDVEYEAEATGNDGIAGHFPTELPTEIPPPDVPEEPTGVAPGIVATFDSTNGCHILSSWLRRNGNLSGTQIQDLHGHIDPWWQQKHNTTNASKAIMFKCGVGYIYRTTNRGLSWVNVTPSSNPPNDAEDSPAPSATDLTYVQYEGNLYGINEHAFLANWDAGDENRSWIAYTDDDCLTWTWVALYSYDTGGVVGPGEPDVNSAKRKWTSDTIPAADHGGVAVLTPTKIATSWTNSVGGGTAQTTLYVAIQTLNSGDVVDTVYNEWLDYQLIGQAKIYTLADDTLLIVYSEYFTGDIYAMAATVSGTTVTFPETATLVADSSDVPAMNGGFVVAILSPDVAMIAISTNDFDERGLYCAKMVISGSTVTTGSFAVIAEGEAVKGANVATIGSSTVAIVYGKVNLEVGATALPALYYHRVSSHSVIATVGAGVTFGDITDVWEIEDPTYEDIYEVAYVPDVAIVGGSAVCLFNHQRQVFPAASVSALKITNGTLGTQITWSGADTDVLTVNSDCPTIEAVGTLAVVVYPNSGNNAAVVTAYDNDLNYVTDFDTVSSVFDAFSVASNGSGIVVQGYISTQFISGVSGSASSSAAPYDNIGISISICGEDGLTVYCTFFNPTDEMIYLRSYDLPALTTVEIDPFDLSTCTLAQYNAKTFIGYVMCYRDYYDHILVFGRLDYSGVKHVMESIDAGATFASLISDWGADHGSAGRISYNDIPYVVRDNGSIGTLYGGIIPVQKLSFAFRVRHGAMDVKKNGLHVLVGGIDDAAGVMIGYSSSPFTTFKNITDNHPITGSITSMVFLK